MISATTVSNNNNTAGGVLKKHIVVWAAVTAFIMCRSEAFASTSRSSGFFGQQHRILRGGASQQQQQSASSQQQQQNNSPMTCVMQAPSAGVSSSSSSSSNENHHNKNNNKHLPRKPISSNIVKKIHKNKNNEKNRKDNNNDDVIVQAEYVAETKLPTDIGQFQLRAYRIPGGVQEPCVIYSRDKPPFRAPSAVPVRIHDQCLTSEVFRSQRCDCKEQLQMALHYIQKHGGCIIYLQQEGRGIGLANKIAAYALQDVGLDTVDANLHLGFPEDSREYGVVPSILQDLQIDSIQLMTNNPRKTHRLQQLGVHVERTLPMVVPQTNPYNHKYMTTKFDRMKHDNLATLLSQDPLQVVPETANSIMAPRKKYLADQYINNGTEMSANAVQVSLMVEEEDDEEALGAVAAEDGYCFGKQSVLNAIAAVQRGEMVVVVDDLNRENEGDFIMAADQCTDLDMAQIVRYSSGVVCVAMEGKRMDELQLPPMVSSNQDPKGTAFSVTVDAAPAKHGITTGISAFDRAKTVQLLADPTATADDFHRPGHLFPLRACEGGVLARQGHTEAAVDLARLAGRQPVGILCEIVSEENPTEMMRLPEMKRFAKRHGFVLTSIADLVQYRRETGQ